MSPRTNAPATAPAGSGPSDAASDGCDAESDDDSDLRRATRLLRLVKLLLGIAVSLLTVLRLLGLL